MLIGARTAAWSGGASKPYDREVDYLESTGAQYINTRFKLGIDSVIRCEITPVSKVNNGMTFWGAGKGDGGGGIGDNIALLCRYGSNNDFQFVCTYPNANNFFTFAYNQKYAVSCVCSSGTLTIGETSTSYVLSVPTRSAWDCYLFAKDNAGSTFRPSACKIHSWSVEENGEKAIDMIPVVKDGVGFMFDKCGSICPITGTSLFPNEGSGVFVLPS